MCLPLSNYILTFGPNFVHLKNISWICKSNIKTQMIPYTYMPHLIVYLCILSVTIFVIIIRMLSLFFSKLNFCLLWSQKYSIQLKFTFKLSLNFVTSIYSPLIRKLWFLNFPTLFSYFPSSTSLHNFLHKMDIITSDIIFKG